MHIFISNASKYLPWWRRLEDVFCLRLQKTSSRHLDQDQYIRFSHTSSRHLQDIFKMSLRRFQDVFKTSSRLHAKTSSRRIIKLNCSRSHVFKTSSWRIQHVFETYCEGDHLQKDLPRSHFWEIYGQCTKFQRVKENSQVLVFYFTTPFSGCLQKHI